MQFLIFRPNLFHILGNAAVGKLFRLFIFGLFALRFFTLWELKDWNTSLKDGGNLLLWNFETKPATLKLRMSSNFRRFNFENKGSQWALYVDLDTILIAFFCLSLKDSISLFLERPQIIIAYSICGWKRAL